MPRRLPVLIFDFGNVVAHFDYARACEALGRPRGLSGTSLLQQARADGLIPLVKRYEAGRMTSEEFSAGFCQILGLSIPHEEFAAAWADIFRINESIESLLRTLKSADYQLVLGSNTNQIHANHFRRQFADALAPFDRLVLSYEIGHIKPSPEFYLSCAEAAEAPPASCIFIDDLNENVEGAKAAGLEGILFEGTERLIGDLTRLGIRIPETTSQESDS